jgi:DNA-binding HxlR family transcriptional regulator
MRADQDGCWQPTGTLKQFAEEIGPTHEALYRALAALEEEGRIRRDIQRICLS